MLIAVTLLVSSALFPSEPFGETQMLSVNTEAAPSPSISPSISPDLLDEKTLFKLCYKNTVDWFMQPP